MKSFLPGFVLLAVGLSACAGSNKREPSSPADAAWDTPAAREAQEFAPQAHAAAEKLRAEARTLESQGNKDEAAVVSEQASVGYQEAFAIARGVKAEQRLQKAQAELGRATARLALLDQRQSVAQADAEALGLRARVALDTVPVGDVEKLSPERALARRAAASQLTSEARGLCMATRLLDPKVPALDALDQELTLLDQQIGVGSIQKDLYPRAIKARSACLNELTQVRRPVTKKAPEAGTSDRLLTILTETNQLFAFRDDRGVVVNVLDPVSGPGALRDPAKSVVELLGKTARAHPEFPLLVVVHTAKKGQEKSAEQTQKTIVDALRAAGAPAVTVQMAGAAEPVVDRRVPQAEKQNTRVEIVFVTPAL